jgi:hypothetical protein
MLFQHNPRHLGRGLQIGYQRRCMGHDHDLRALGGLRIEPRQRNNDQDVCRARPLRRGP